MLARSVILFLCAFSTGTSFAQSSSQLWKIYYDSGNSFLKSNSSEAIRLFAKAESIAKKDLGIYHDNYLAIIGALGIANENSHNYPQAEKYLAETVKFGKEVYGEDDPRMLQSEYNLALFYRKTDKISEASILFKKIFSSSERTTNRNLYALSGTQLVNISEIKHQLDSALAIAHKVIGSNLLKDYESISYDLQLLEGRILRKLKMYNEAQASLTNLQKKLISRGSAFRTLTRSTNLQISLLDIDLGRYGKAEKDLLQQYRLAKGESGTEPAMLTEITNAIAFTYERLGVYDKAITYYQEALAYCASGANNTGSCKAIENNIAGMYLKLRQYDKAIEKYRSFVDSRKDDERFSDPDFLATMNNLATALRQNGKVEEAVKYYNEALLSLEKIGKLNDDFAATVMNNLGVSKTMVGSYDIATINFQDALKIKESFYGNNSPLLLDLYGNLAVSLWASGKKNEALPYFRRSLELGLREVKYNFPNLTEAEQLQFYAQQKENFERFNTLAIGSGSEMPEMLTQMFNNQVFLKSLSLFTNKKATAAVKALNNPKLTSTLDLKQSKSVLLGNYYQSTLDDLTSKGISLSKLENEIDSLDKIIRHQLTSLQTDDDYVTWNDIQKSIPADEASVDIIRFRKYDLIGNKIGFTDSVYYAALITTVETVNNPQVVLLKNGYHMENRLFSYYKNTTKFDLDDSISIRNYWSPIESKIKDKKKIHFTPDGIYRQVNLNTIRDRNGKYNIEKYEIRSSLNPAGLITKVSDKPADLSKLVLMGNATFGIEQAQIGAGSIQSQFTNLPGTQEEITEIAKVVKTPSTQFVKAQASEQNLRKLKSPGVLHIATHGYFSVDVSYLNEQAKADYLFHSGLLLSAGKTDSNPTENDGIITAYDIINLDLANTDLVVLSACETGVGKNEFGEGIHGLQRSFMLAGAKDLVISLWRVDDRVTKDMMIKFYQNLLQKRSPNEALRMAQLEIMKREPNRRNWGSFVTIGSN